MIKAQYFHVNFVILSVILRSKQTKKYSDIHRATPIKRPLLQRSYFAKCFRFCTGDLIRAGVITFIGVLFLVMSFCSPYWIESYDESFSSFKKMGLWEYCFKDFYYPNYQFPKKFNGCHNIFSHVSYIQAILLFKQVLDINYHLYFNARRTII